MKEQKRTSLWVYRGLWNQQSYNKSEFIKSRILVSADKKLNSSTHQHLQKKQLKLPTVFTKPHYSEQPTRTISLAHVSHSRHVGQMSVCTQSSAECIVGSLCWIRVLTHHASIKKQQVGSRSEAGREGAGRRQQGDRETKAGHGND